ncbi:hypothetical protein VPHG_00168 [Vibrio phage 11895-B1]|uniref:hypothetical protein n=1 Tax=Vibrio phage 11895-B1 TaxID=754075 RepID=UPI0002C0CF69|nr:hypothetical protein VPHG_00168 [Vibrio phage 11895-B1]AGH32231.1 hypothetical protein VPHG_00168 [Vibrio phage 11895-B1]
MKIINFVNPNNTKEAYDLLIHSIFADFEYKQVRSLLSDIGYFIPEDQFIAFKGVCDIMVEMDIGDRVLL